MQLSCVINYYTVLIFFLFLQLSMWLCTDELRARADELIRNSKRDAAKHYIGAYYVFQYLRIVFR